MNYQVLNWDDHYEAGRTPGFKNKTKMMMPCKQGLGYSLLVQRVNGAAIYGAWCALIMVLSRQAPPRKGYLTDDGSRNGRNLTPNDLFLITGISEEAFQEMLEICSSARVGWIRSYKAQASHTPPIRRPREPHWLPLTKLNLTKLNSTKLNPPIVPPDDGPPSGSLGQGDGGKEEKKPERRKKSNPASTEKNPDRKRLMLSLNRLFRRKEKTPWSEKEHQALTRILKRPDWEGEAMELGNYYMSGCKYLRRDIQTLINNWSGELDRARNYDPERENNESGLPQRPDYDNLV